VSRVNGARTRGEGEARGRGAAEVTVSSWKRPDPISSMKNHNMENFLSISFCRSPFQYFPCCEQAGSFGA
jgi:hypothetical protein